MKNVQFNPNGSGLTAKAVFLGKLVADYEVFLRQKESNAQVTLLEGDNLNPEDDQCVLPLPPTANEGRRVILETGFYGLDIADYPNFEIRLEIWQDGALIGSNNEIGQLNGGSQYSIIFIKLVI